MNLRNPMSLAGISTIDTLPSVKETPSAKPSLPKLYIAGPMTGLPDNNYPAFHAAAAFFRKRGYEVSDPSELQPSKPLAEMQWLDWMKLTIPMMMDCQIVVLLPGYMNSKGAVAELALANHLGIHSCDLGWAEVSLTGVA